MASTGDGQSSKKRRRWPEIKKTQKEFMTIYNPVMPLQAALEETFTKNHKLMMVGTVSSVADRFHVDLINRCSSNIYLHISSRLKEGTLVRNTHEGGTWGPEERHMSHMPFVPGQQFQMEIRNEGDCFGVYINSAKVFTYVHCLPANEIDMMEVNGDVTLCYVQFYMPWLKGHKERKKSFLHFKSKCIII